MGQPPFESFAPDAEDVVLWRALQGVGKGRYVAISDEGRSSGSVTQAFTDRGWHSIEIAPKPGERSTWKETLAERLAGEDWEGHDVHILFIGGAVDPDEILAGLDLRQWRPWTVVVTSSEPRVDFSAPGWEGSIIGANYQLCLMTGRSRIYQATERNADIGAQHRVAASSADDFTTPKERAALTALAEATLAREEAEADVRLWQDAATKRWLELMDEGAFVGRQLADERRTLDEEYVAIHHSLTWRVARELQRLRVRFGAKPSER
jgi:hypothetical protein